MSRSTVMQVEEDLEYPIARTGLRTKIFISCLALVGIGFINSLWTRLDYQVWYNELIKPIFSPSPRWIVGVIWTVMYITVGFSVGMIWQIATKSLNTRLKQRAELGLLIFGMQVSVNMIVPYFFFDLNNLYLVLSGVTANLILAISMAVYYRRINKTAAFILIPYIVWLLYATILDGALLFLN